MKILAKNPLNHKTIVIGMSQAGKSTLSKLTKIPLICFDYHFCWHDIETLSLPVSSALNHIINISENHETFIIDGWHTSDLQLNLAPSDYAVYVVYADFETIQNRYAENTLSFDLHFEMYKKWYSIQYPEHRIVRYFQSKDSIFLETDENQFKDLTHCSFLKYNQ